MRDCDDAFRASLAREMVDDLLAGRPGRIADTLEEFASGRLDPGIRQRVIDDLRAREHVAEQKLFREMLCYVRAHAGRDDAGDAGAEQGRRGRRHHR